MAEKEVRQVKEERGVKKPKGQKDDGIKKEEQKAISNPDKSILESGKSAVKKELLKQQKAFQKLEQDIAALNTQKEAMEVKLAHPEIYSNGDEFKKTDTAYKQLAERLSIANKE